MWPEQGKEGRSHSLRGMEGSECWHWDDQTSVSEGVGGVESFSQSQPMCGLRALGPHVSWISNQFLLLAVLCGSGEHSLLQSPYLTGSYWP